MWTPEWDKKRNQGWSSTWSTTRKYNSRVARFKDLPPVIRSYWPYRDELSVNDGISMKGSRIIIPEPPTPQKKLSWTSYIIAIKVLKKHVFKPEMPYIGSELMQNSRINSRIQYARKTFRHNQRKLYTHMTSPAEHGELSAQICLTAIIMNIL